MPSLVAAAHMHTRGSFVTVRVCVHACVHACVRACGCVHARVSEKKKSKRECEGL